MNEEEADRILDAANFLLKWFPYERPELRSKKIFRRKPYLRARFIENRKVFFHILKEKYRGLNKRDKARRYKIILHLREILHNEIPEKKDNNYIYITKIKTEKFVLVIKEIRRRRRQELYLYSIYPKSHI